MNARTWGIILLIAALSWCALRSDNAVAKALHVEAFGEEVRQHTAMLHLTGCAVAVMQDEDVLFRRNFGFADLGSRQPLRDDSIFWLASVTKTFSAAMLMRYVEQGKIRLSDRITSYPFTSVGFFPNRVTPGVQLKHVLSHTSESTPGETFIYHGGRFNFLSGVFNSLRSASQSSFVSELQSQIVEPLQLDSTFAGYPSEDNPGAMRIVTPYRFEESKRSFVPNLGMRELNTAFPAAGLLSSVDDLLTYSAALDNDLLMNSATYQKMTSPMRNRGGIEHPYGLGWFVQKAHGVTMHWAYGLGDSDSALLLRIPELKLTLVVLSNCSFASAPFRFGSGNALNSPFVVSFVKHFVLPKDEQPEMLNYDRPSTLREGVFESQAIFRDELCAQVFCRTFVERRIGEDLHSEQLLRLLVEVDSRRLDDANPSLMNVLSHHPNDELDSATERFVKATRAKPYNPEVEFDIARRLQAKGFKDDALNAFRRVADHSGFEEQASTIEACAETARLLAEIGRIELALEYQWRSICFAYRAGYGTQDKLTAFRELVSSLEHPDSK